ncbi:hypothetical protein [Streptomyces sp. NPDC058773]|uniref:hypothetical protein n=1 Tax=Streptomyces sp. NPDC058773 TaxID=3346632 RepID=UPI0036B5D32A
MLMELLPAIGRPKRPLADMGDVRLAVVKMYHGRISASVMEITERNGYSAPCWANCQSL